MTNPTYFYLTAEDYKEQTFVPAMVRDLSDDAIESLLLEIMAGIDAYVGPQVRYDSKQEFYFPRYEDTDDAGINPFIPRPVSLATRIIADATLKRRISGVSPHELQSETNLGHSFTRKQTAMTEKGFEDWPPEAFRLLDQYRNNGGTLALSSPDGVLWSNEQLYSDD